VRYALILMMLARVSFGQLEMGPGTNVTVTGLTIPSAFPTNKLTAYWNMDNVSVTTVYDDAGSKDGTAVGGPTFTAGKLANAINFVAASNQYLNLGSAYIGNYRHMTQAAWVKKADDGLALDVFAFSSTVMIGPFYVFAVGGLTPSYAIRNDAQTYFIAVASDTAITPNEWTHVAVTSESSLESPNLDLDIKFYINGDETGIVTNVTPTTTGFGSTALNTANMGALRRTTSRFSTGSIDEAGIWSRRLSGDEIKSLYNESRGRTYPESPTVMAWVNSGGGWHHYTSNELTYVDGVTNSFSIDPFAYDGTNLVIGGTNYIWDAPRAYSSLTAGQIAYYVQRTAHRYDYALSTSTNLLAVSEPWDISDGNPDCVLALDFEHVGAGGDVAIGGDPRDHSRLASEVVATGAPIHRMPVRAGTE